MIINQGAEVLSGETQKASKATAVLCTFKVIKKFAEIIKKGGGKVALETTTKKIAQET